MVLKGEIKMDEVGGKRKRNRGKRSKSKDTCFWNIFFGILERNKRLSVEVVEDVSADIQRDDKESKEGKFDLYG